jgi:hypothetical protein
MGGQSMKSEAAQRFAHRLNLAGYRKILAGHLTPLERDFVERRAAEEKEALRKLSASPAPKNAQHAR